MQLLDNEDKNFGFPEEDDADYMEAVPRKRSRKPLIAGLVLLLLAGIVCFLLLGCRVKEVQVSGNTVYSQEELGTLLTAPGGCKNSVYAWFYYTFRYNEDIPFVEDVHVSLQGPRQLNVTVEEYELLGYVPYADSYLYFDGNGTIVGQLGRVLENLPSVTGFDFAVAEVGQTLPIEDINQLENLLLITEKAGELAMGATDISFAENGTMTLTCGGVQIKLGLGTALEKKLNLSAVLLKELEGKSGILHMEDYDGTNATRSFEETAS